MPPWKYHPGAWADGLRPIADEVLYLPLDHNKELVFGRRDMSWRTKTRPDSHVENSEQAWIRVNNLGGYSGEFRRFKFRCDTRFHFRSKRQQKRFCCILSIAGPVGQKLPYSPIHNTLYIGYCMQRRS